MNRYEAIVIAIAGLLQLSVGIYGLRLTHLFGVAKVGWSLFCAFALLAVVHLIEAIDQLQSAEGVGMSIEIIYAFISFLLLTAMAHLEVVLKERQRLERQARKLQTIGQLAEGITHDFNNIVTAIQGYVSLLLLKPHDPDTVESLNQIDIAVNRAGALTRQLLAFGRGHSAQIELVNLNEVIENLVQMLRQLLGSKIVLENNSAVDVPLIVGDISMIEEIIVNLAVNARDAMAKGGRLTIGASTVTLDKAQTSRHRDARAGEFVCVRVRDTGCGIAPEVLPRIFEPFFTTKEVGKGTGIGLATVYRIARQHSGWVEVQSSLGAGSEFAVYFPCAPRTVVEASKGPPSPRVEPSKLGAMVQLPQVAR
ncbi:MAG TPA: ATP-binding protein [Verrucomicrobiae bacterium]